MGSNFLLVTAALPQLASLLLSERKRQNLSRAEAAAVCNVSESFIRDIESDPGRCSLNKVVQYMQGLGLVLQLADQHAYGAVIAPGLAVESGAS